MMMQQPEPDDFVLATGETHSVRTFVEKCFLKVGVRIEWRGEGKSERGIDGATGREVIESIHATSGLPKWTF